MTNKTSTRRLQFVRVAALLAAVAGTAGLSACNTMHGAGQDLSAAGHDVSRGAAASQNAIVKHTGASSN